MKSIKAKLLISVGIVVLSFSVIFLSRTYSLIEFNIENLIHHQLALALNYDLATREYIAEEVRPVMYRLVKKDEFIPETMSTSYISRNIFEKVRKQFPDYIIKFSAKNPRNSANLAGPEELRMIRYFGDNPEETRWTGEVSIAGKQYLAKFSARRMVEECLRCHGDPSKAPASLLKIYGAKGGFNYQLGEVVGLDTVAIPTEKITALLRSETLSNFALIGVEILFLFVSVALVLKFVVTSRITKIAGHFTAAGEQIEGADIEPIEMEGHDEIAIMAAGFNGLAAKLNDSYRLLEAKVGERTGELRTAVERLRKEVEERKRAEEALGKSEEFNRTLLENLGDRIFAKDAEGRYTLMNKVSYDFWGIPYGQAIGKTDWEIHNELTAEVFSESDRAVLESGLSYSVEEQVKAKDGRDLVLSVVKAPLTEKTGAITGLVGISRDITEQKRMEQALKKSEERFRTLVSNIPGVVYRLARDPDWRCEFISDEIENLSGYPASDFIDNRARTCLSIVHPEDMDAVVSAEREAVKSRNPYVNEYRIIKADGSVRWVYDKGQGIFDDDGNLLWLDGAMFDITEQKAADEALRESEERHRSIFENIVDVYYRADLNGNLVLVSPSGLKLMGYGSIEEVVGKNIAQEFYADPEERAMLLGHLEEHGEIKGFTGSLKRKDGTTIIMETNSRYVYDNAGEPVAVEGVFRDITERKLAEEALRESEERFRYLAEASFEAIVIHGDGVLLNANERYFEMFGYEPHELLGKQAIPMTVAPESLDFVMGQVRSGITEPYEAVGMRKDGTKFLMELHARQMQYQGRSVRVAAIRDITGARKAQEALRESEERFRTAFDNAATGMALMAMDGYFIKVNKIFCKMLGYSEEELLGLTWVEITSPEDLNGWYAWLRRVKEGAEGAHEKQFIHKLGHPVWVLVSTSLVRDGEGRVLYYVSVFQDITERRLAEEKLLSYQKQLRSMASEMSLIEERERRAIATDLHDRIGQTLALAKIKLGNLKSSVSTENLADSIGEINLLIEQTIEDTRSLIFELSPPVLYELGLEAAVEWLAEQFRKNNGLECNLRVDKTPVSLNDDMRVLLFQAVRELLHNVVKHAKTRRAKVAIYKEQGLIRIEVNDSGVGFETSSIETRSDSSSGFGLFSIRERLKSLGGRIEIDSKPGMGTRVAVVAPLLTAE